MKSSASVAFLLCLVSTWSSAAETKPPMGNEAAAAIGRIEALGGQCEFDRDGRLLGVDLASDRVSVTDADLPLLLALPDLKKLKLSGSGITGPGVGPVSGLANLTDLSFLDAQIDNAALGLLARLTNLRSLSIRRSPLLDDEGIEHLAKLPKLTNLGLLEVGITDKGLVGLSEMPQLRLLDLRGCSQISDAGLDHLRVLKNLKVLRLGGYQITDASLEIIKDFPSLVGLTIEEAAVTDAGLASLAHLPLEEINLGRCYSITDEGFQYFKGMANLRQFSIRDIPLGNDALTCLAGKDKLACLKLSGTGIDDAALEHLRGLKNLSRLELRQTPLSDAAVDLLASLKTLQYLDITQTAISDAGAKRLAELLSNCKIVR